MFINTDCSTQDEIIVQSDKNYKIYWEFKTSDMIGQYYLKN